MKKTEILSSSVSLLMIVSLVIAFITKDVIASKLMAALGIIAGAYTFHCFSKQKNSTRNDESPKI